MNEKWMKIHPRFVSWGRSSEWGGNEKMQWYAENDEKDVEICKKDRLIGNVGEIAGHVYCRRKIRIPCPVPNLLDEKGSSKLWADDIRSFERIFLVRSGNKIPLSSHISVKSQGARSERKYGRSWLFQLKTKYRAQDPMLYNPSDTLILFVSLKTPFNFESDEGWEAKMVLCLWRDIWDRIKEPAIDGLAGKKKAIYYDDIKNSILSIKDIEVDDF